MNVNPESSPVPETEAPAEAGEAAAKPARIVAHAVQQTL